MTPRRAVPQEVKDLRRRLRKFSGADLERIAAFSDLRRSTVYAIRSATTRVPKPETQKKITETLEYLVWPFPKARKLGLESFADGDEAEVWGASVFEVCDVAAHVHSEYNAVVDLDRQASDAVYALRRGESLKRVLGYVRDVNVRGEPETHPVADQVRAALKNLYRKVYGGKAERAPGRPKRSTGAALWTVA